MSQAKTTMDSNIKRTPFHTLLIANRGEIAMRVLRSAKAMGLRTVAVYSSADADAPHVLHADRAVHIGPAEPAQSYLNIDAIVAAAQASGADAVHPGYGFLAENAAFAQHCRDAGLVFVGPSPESIRAMGDKAAAKRLMQTAGVPCIPGYQGEDQTTATLLREAEAIGWPVMIKAVAGGGGRGMRLVEGPQQFATLLQSAQSEALHAFGDATVLLERAVRAPRHIEIQVMADRHGHAIHLGERDCSVQRRHQKIIEEAPSPAVSPELRQRMGEAALQAVRAIGYEGAGTLEFLLDDNGDFWFMEMNTRLQVEHPVTEALTGLDLVALQLRIAAGEPLALRQEDVRFEGHAIEVRLCAESPSQGFVPQSGTMDLWQLPESPPLRVEHALASGAQVPPHYDSMIAKLIAHGATRDEARQRLLAGLADTVALGVATNQHFLLRCLAHPVFAAGGATTAFIAQHQEELLAEDAGQQAQAAAVAAALLQAGTDRPPSPLAHTLMAPLRFEIDGQGHAASVQRLPDGSYAVALDSVEPVEIGLRFMGHGQWQVQRQGVQSPLRALRSGERLLMHWAGRAYEVRDTSLAPPHDTGAHGGDGLLRAAMSGRVTALLAREGELVAAGQPLLTLEAMKMEHLHCAPRAGRVSAVHVAVGEQVAMRQVVAEVAVAAA